MANALGISAFFPIHPIIDSREEWNARVIQDVVSLTSLAAFVPHHKYYFLLEGNKFCRSDWMIAEHLKGWIGVWATEWLVKKEEAVFRTLWRISYSDSIGGILSIQSRLLETLAIASRTLELEDREIAIDVHTLEEQLSTIDTAILAAETGLSHLKDTYGSTTEKGLALEAVRAGFIKTLQRFVSEIHAQIRNREGNLDLIASVKLSNSISPSATLLDEPKIRLPFVQPKRADQIAFNQNFPDILGRMETFLATLQKDISVGEKQTRQYKTKNTEMPWTVFETPEGSLFFHCHIPLVPKGEGGKFKSDKFAWCSSRKVLVAKLSTKMIKPIIEEMARSEEKFLRRCTQKKLPNIVETFDVIWSDGTVRKQVIYQKYCPHGNLESSLERLKNEPQTRKKILKGILRGLAALHNEGIVHLDLKPSNIYLDENDEPFIGDFGFAADLDTDIIPRGSPLFMDPSITVNEGKLRTAAHHDIWSFGMLMYGMLRNTTHKTPWSWLLTAKNYAQVKYLHVNHKDRFFPEPHLKEVWMHACWETLRVDPSIRPTAQQLYVRLEKV